MAQSTYREYVQITGNESVMMAQSSSGHDDVSASTEELEEYKHASNVNVSDFVLVKLSILSNDYDTWKAQMLSHLDKLKIRDIVENRGDWLKSRSQDIAIKYDILLKGWILGSLDEELLRRHFDCSDDVQSIWSTLAIYHRDVSASKEELEEYMHASKVNVSNFVSVKLSGHSNYHIWKAQMLSLLDKLMIRDFVENTNTWLKAKSKDITKRYNILLKGWILGSLDEKVLRHLDYSANVQSIWWTLEDEYCFRVGLEARVIIKVRAEDSDNDAPLGKLRDATREGNWWRAQSILRKHKFPITRKINDVDETMLHIAVGEGKNYFVQKLLNSIQNEELIEEKNNKGQTALHIAALVGNKCAAELLVKKRYNLLNVKDSLGKVPLLIAYKTNHISTFAYLLEVTKSAGKLLSKDSKSFEGFIIRLIYRKEYAWKNAGQKLVNRSSLLFYSFGYMYARAEHTLWRMKRFKNNYYSWLLPEIVMLLLGEIPNSCTLSGMSVDSSLHFGASFTLLYVVFPPVDGFSNLAPIKDIEKRKKEYEVAKDFLKETVSYVDSCNLDKSRFYKSIALEAVRLDVYEVLRLIISHFKETIEYPNEKHNIIQLAILHRSEKVYNHIFYPLIKQKETHRELKDYFGNNLLHLVGRLAPSYVLSRTTGAALQIQQELQWYEEVKKFMEPMQLTDKNIDDETPDEVFSREHENLVKEGQKWMKATAESSSITAALIVTIVFAAAITVPGGSNQETGIPLFKKQIAFTVFAVSDAISLFSASTSLLVFLSILTTRFAEKDFLHSLPRRLLIALFLLILSTSSMMLAFSAILFLVFCDQRPWMLAPIGVFTCMPIAAIVYLQLPLVTLWCNNTGVATMPAKPGVKPQMW
ncbi:Ankyrin repeat-containing protein [Artemisia annua]|uniref:Ankyrin repeat-containing protein n=1 Tax=Artemisia annua TaxID=35608 RepID=A0A2U1N419_ARTAN|nr:Ankyrin repeat-containing protein [Artemisia annua]